MGLAARIESRKPITRKLVIALDPDAVEALQKAANASSRAFLGGDDAIEKVERELEAARARLRESSETIVVQAITPEDWDALQRQHPATDEQIEAARKDLGPMASVPWNVDTFTPAAWAACQVVPADDTPLDYEQAASLLKRFTQGEKSLLLRTLQEVNEATITVDALGE